jgi:hypothetical protein
MLLASQSHEATRRSRAPRRPPRDCAGAELRRLLELWRRQWPTRKAWSPSKANPSGQTDLDVIEAAWQAQGLDLRFRR